MKYKGPWELYDMEADRTERHDLIADEPEVAKDLISRWEAWANRADVDPWTGPVRNDWGGEFAVPGKKKLAPKEKQVGARKT